MSQKIRIVGLGNKSSRIGSLRDLFDEGRFTNRVDFSCFHQPVDLERIVNQTRGGFSGGFVDIVLVDAKSFHESLNKGESSEYGEVIRRCVDGHLESPTMVILKDGDEDLYDNVEVLFQKPITYADFERFLMTCGLGILQEALEEKGALERLIEELKKPHVPTLMVIDGVKDKVADAAVELSKLHPDQSCVFIDINGNAERFEMAGCELVIQCVSNLDGFFSSIETRSPDMVFFHRMWEEPAEKKGQVSDRKIVQAKLLELQRQWMGFACPVEDCFRLPQIVVVTHNNKDLVCSSAGIGRGALMTIPSRVLSNLLQEKPDTVKRRLTRKLTDINDRLRSRGSIVDLPVGYNQAKRVFAPLWKLQGLGK